MDASRRCLLILALWAGTHAVAQAADCLPDPAAALAALNAVRAVPRTCGARQWPAAPPLRPHPVLDASARAYAVELAARDRIEHVGAAGDSLRRRLHQAGYAMRVSAENLVGGPETVDEALAQWLASPVHCEALMSAEYEEAGMACATGPGRYQRYWVLHVAAPRAEARSSPDRSP